MVHSFRIGTSEVRVPPVRWCWVRVHPTAQHMRAAAYRSAPHHGRDFHAASLACFQPSPYRERFVDGKWEQRHSNYAGTMRLVGGDVTAEVVAHELVHAAVQVYRSNVKQRVVLGEDCGPREEQLAYIYGELFASFQEGWEQWVAWHGVRDE